MKSLLSALFIALFALSAFASPSMKTITAAEAHQLIKTTFSEGFSTSTNGCLYRVENIENVFVFEVSKTGDLPYRFLFDPEFSDEPFTLEEDEQSLTLTQDFSDSLMILKVDKLTQERTITENIAGDIRTLTCQ